jgi:hypothetical protein
MEQQYGKESEENRMCVVIQVGSGASNFTLQNKIVKNRLLDNALSLMHLIKICQE